MRHVSRTHRVALDWLFDRINLDPKIQIKYIDTNYQLADILTKVNFTRDEWNNLLNLFKISVLNSTNYPEAMSKGMQPPQLEQKMILDLVALARFTQHTRLFGGRVPQKSLDRPLRSGVVVLHSASKLSPNCTSMAAEGSFVLAVAALVLLAFFLARTRGPRRRAVLGAAARRAACWAKDWKPVSACETRIGGVCASAPSLANLSARSLPVLCHSVAVPSCTSVSVECPLSLSQCSIPNSQKGLRPNMLVETIFCR